MDNKFREKLGSVLVKEKPQATVEPASKPAVSPNGLAVRCNTCDSVLYDPDFVGGGLTLAEKIDHLRRMADGQRWRFTAMNDGDSFVTCPACVLLDQRANPPVLSAFDERSPCPKCGKDDADTRYRTGLEPDATHPRDHLERECKRCSYRWPQACLDAGGAKSES